MKPEDIAALLKDVGFKPLIDALAIMDPSLCRALETIVMVQNQKFGNVTITIQDGKIVYIEPTVKYKLV